MNQYPSSSSLSVSSSSRNGLESNRHHGNAGGAGAAMFSDRDDRGVGGDGYDRGGKANQTRSLRGMLENETISSGQVFPFLCS